MKYRVTIKREGAANETKTIEADSRFAVYDKVRSEGGLVASISEGAGFAFPTSFNLTLFGSGVKRREVITMSKNLSAMVKAGLSLSRALSILERQSGRKRLGVIIHQISEAVAKGSTFHEALAVHDKVFSTLYVAMVKAGEESGSLAEALLIVGTQMERTEELIGKIKGAMIYPAIVISAIILVAILMLLFVVPTLTATFEQLGVALPFATRAIIAVSNFVQSYWYLVIGGLMLLVFGGIVFARTKEGSAMVVSITLHLPVIGELARETYAARTARTLASLLASGVPVLSALSITEEVVSTPSYARVLAEATERVKKGDPLSAAFIEHPKLYPIMMSDMTAVGEETGKLSEMLVQVAEFYEGDVGQKTKDLSTIIEPILMLLIGGVVGVFAVSMIAPIYSLSSAI